MSRKEFRLAVLVSIIVVGFMIGGGVLLKYISPPPEELPDDAFFWDVTSQGYKYRGAETLFSVNVRFYGVRLDDTLKFGPNGLSSNWEDTATLPKLAAGSILTVPGDARFVRAHGIANLDWRRRVVFSCSTARSELSDAEVDIVERARKRAYIPPVR